MVLQAQQARQVPQGMLVQLVLWASQEQTDQLELWVPREQLVPQVQLELLERSELLEQ